MDYLVDALAAIAMAIAGPMDGVPDGLPRPCRTISVRIGSEELDFDVCDCQPIPGPDRCREHETDLAHRYYRKHTGRRIVGGLAYIDTGGQLVAFVMGPDAHATYKDALAHRVLRALIHDDVRDLLDLLP